MGRHYGNSCHGILIGCDKLESVSVPETILTLGDRCFRDCSSLKAIKLGKQTKKLGKDCFAGCSALSYVEIASENLEGIPEGCFNDCTSLQRMSIRMKTPPETILSDAGLDQFAGAGPMSNLFVPQESADAYRESSLWKGWENIIPTDLYALDEYESRKLTDMGYGRFTEPVDVHGNYNYYSLDHEKMTATFLQSRSSHPGKGEWFESLLHVTIPEYVLYDYKKYTVRILGDGCFRECYRLMDVSIPSTVREFGRNCFTFSMPMASVILPEGVTTLGIGCFLESYISKIDLPSSLISLGRRCFAESTRLSSVILRSSDISTISMGCFEYCEHLSEFVCYATQVPELEFDGVNSPFYGTNASEGTLYVQKHLVDAYKAAPGWNEWGTILPIDAYGTVDAIERTAIAEKDGAIYDLQGRKVTTPQRNGLYIKNGKKYIFKD